MKKCKLHCNRFGPISSDSMYIATIIRDRKSYFPKYNKILEKTGWFCEWIDDAFDAYIINLQVIILSQKKIVSGYESNNSIGDVGCSDDEDLLSH